MFGESSLLVEIGPHHLPGVQEVRRLCARYPYGPYPLKISGISICFRRIVWEINIAESFRTS